MTAEPFCYGRTVTHTWAQEWYETASRHAAIRTRTLRRLGWRAVSQAMGSQVTPVGRVRMTLVSAEPPDVCHGCGSDYATTCSCAAVRTESLR